MYKKWEKDQTTEILKDAVITKRMDHISKALSEVKQIENGRLRKRAARAFLKELREEE